MWAGWGKRGGVAALHHKTVLPILGILSTDAAFCLSPRLLSFQFLFFGLRRTEGEATQVSQ